MKLISHRGNTNGKNPDKENSPSYILDTLQKGYDVEIDIWFIDNMCWLGHDEPTYKIDLNIFHDYYNKIWYHCKNLEALLTMSKHDYHNYFWHQEDDFTLTSTKHIWTYPGNLLTTNSIAVLPEQVHYEPKELSICFGICSDYIENYLNLI
jgi:hypothetical protein